MKTRIHLGQIRDQNDLLKLTRAFNKGEVGLLETDDFEYSYEMYCTLPIDESLDFELSFVVSSGYNCWSMKVCGYWGEHIFQTGYAMGVLERKSAKDAVSLLAGRLVS